MQFDKGRFSINYISVEFQYFKPDIRIGEIMDGLRELEQVKLIMRADLPYIGVHPTPQTFKHDFHLCCFSGISTVEEGSLGIW